MTLKNEFIILDIGGSLKKYTYSDSKWVLIGMIIPILMFFFALNSVYAYFTASLELDPTSFSTGNIVLTFTKDIETTQNSVAVVDGEMIYPGQTFDFAGTIKNSGNSPLYAILVWDVVVVDGEDETVIATEYYTPSGAKLTKKADNTYTGAEEMAKDDTNSFNLTYSFGFNDSELDQYQGMEVKFVFNARGIQTDNVTQDVATQILVTMTDI